MDPDDIDALLERANQLLEAGKPDESLRCLDELAGQVTDVEDRIEWASLRAWALSELDRHEEALDTLRPALEEFPESSRLLGTLGVVLSNTNDLDDACDALEQAVELNPEDEVANANLALVYEKLRDYRNALELYEKALRLGADIDWVLQRRAAVLTECGRYEEAKTTLRRYLSLVPEDAAQWISLAILCSDDEEFDDAFACYRQAETLDPDSPMLRLNWGVTAVRAGRLTVARAQLRHLRRLEPRSSRPELLRAFILEEEGQVAAARRLYDVLLSRRGTETAELGYILEMAMDFFARHRLRPRCEQLLNRAYAENVCTVELCEAYRELTGDKVERPAWYSLLIEADYRAGLPEVYERGAPPAVHHTRFLRDYQVVARDRDEAVGVILDFAQRMGEQNPRVREFVGEEPMENAHTGIYEVEPECLVLSDEKPD